MKTPKTPAPPKPLPFRTVLAAPPPPRRSEGRMIKHRVEILVQNTVESTEEFIQRIAFVCDLYANDAMKWETVSLSFPDQQSSRTYREIWILMRREVAS